ALSSPAPSDSRLLDAVSRDHLSAVPSGALIALPCTLFITQIRPPQFLEPGALRRTRRPVDIQQLQHANHNEQDRPRFAKAPVRHELLKQEHHANGDQNDRPGETASVRRHGWRSSAHPPGLLRLLPAQNHCRGSLPCYDLPLIFSHSSWSSRIFSWCSNSSECNRRWTSTSTARIFDVETTATMRITAAKHPSGTKIPGSMVQFLLLDSPETGCVSRASDAAGSNSRGTRRSLRRFGPFDLQLELLHLALVLHFADTHLLMDLQFLLARLGPEDNPHNKHHHQRTGDWPYDFRPEQVFHSSPPLPGGAAVKRRRSAAGALPGLADLHSLQFDFRLL